MQRPSFKVDEDLSEDIVDHLRGRGFITDSVRGQGWTGRPDAIIWPDVSKERRALVTADKGFAMRAATTRGHCGLIILRPERESRQRYLALIDALLAHNVLSDLTDTIVVVTEAGIRVRRS